ncbi:MAG: hypothetical protein ACI91O_001181 [Candidatus Poriferisodalaceae bacterium]|jgi:uncharacterized protein (DUF983 family)
MRVQPPRPKLRNWLWAFTGACPVCGQRHLFQRWRRMVADCPNCGLHFERIEGHWLGAVATNTVMSAIVVMATIVIALIVTLPDASGFTLLLIAAPVAIIAPPLFFPLSKTIWTAVDVRLRPLEPGEASVEDDVQCPMTNST